MQYYYYLTWYVIRVKMRFKTVCRKEGIILNMNKQSEYQAKYDAENMKQYSVKYPIKIYKLVEQAMEQSGLNRTRWTTQAIIEKLERDGFLKND